MTLGWGNIIAVVAILVGGQGGIKIITTFFDRRKAAKKAEIEHRKMGIEHEQRIEIQKAVESVLAEQKVASCKQTEIKNIVDGNLSTITERMHHLEQEILMLRKQGGIIPNTSVLPEDPRQEDPSIGKRPVSDLSYFELRDKRTRPNK